MIIDYELFENDTFDISYVNDNGKIIVEKIILQKNELFNWNVTKTEKNSDKVFRNFDNKFVRKSAIHTTAKLSNHRILEILLSKNEEFKNKIFKFNFPTIGFVDIEVEVLDEFPSITNPESKVLTISIVNENNCLVLGLNPLSEKSHLKIENNLKEYLSNDKINFKYVQFKNESELLFFFFSKIYNRFSCLTGWNFIDFDWSYLISRSRKLMIPLENFIKFSKNPKEKFMPKHKLVVDYLQIFKKFDTTMSDRESYSLDSVANLVLNLQKVKYNGTLTELFVNDYDTYVFYNAVDSFLVQMIHKKVQTLNILLQLATLTKTEVSKSLGTLRLIENVLLEEYLKENKLLLNSDEEHVNTGIVGAYVKDPKKGHYSNFGVFDFSSLYPSIMRQFNISPETFLGNNLEKNENNIKTITGATFKKEDGVLKKKIGQFYKDRKYNQKIALDIEKEIKILEEKIKNKRK